MNGAGQSGSPQTTHRISIQTEHAEQRKAEKLKIICGKTGLLVLVGANKNDRVETYTIDTRKEALGNGGESVVYLATRKSDGAKVVAKIYNRLYVRSAHLEQNRDSVIRLLDGRQDSYRQTHIMPLLDYGKVRMRGKDGDYEMPFDICPVCIHLKTAKSDYPSLRGNIIPSILCALKFLHSNGLVHRDIKPDNIYTYEGVIVVGDFGTISKRNIEFTTTQRGENQTHGYAPTIMQRGTIGYIAPEAWWTPDFPSDFYSLGCTIATLYNGGNHIWHNFVKEGGKRYAELLKQIEVEGLPLECSKEYSDLQVLVDALIVYEPKRRARADDVLLWIENLSEFIADWDIEDDSQDAQTFFEIKLENPMIVGKHDVENLKRKFSNPQGFPKRIKIPDSVVIIDESAFLSCQTIHEVKMPKNLRSIGKKAFAFCRKLERIVIPSSVEIIEYKAFYKCKRLDSFEINDIHNSKLQYIENEVFRGCYNLRTVDLPASLKKLGSDMLIEKYDIPGGVFYGCEALVSIDMRDTKVTKIEDNTFFLCESLQNFIFPANIEDIGAYAFCSCRSLENLEIGEHNKIKSIGSSAFRNCEKIKEINIPNSVRKIGHMLFCNCYSLTQVTGFNNLRIDSIGFEMFACCENLPSVQLPSSIREIGDSAFYGCAELRNLRIPDGVTEIGEGAFSYCVNIQHIGNQQDSGLRLPDSLISIREFAFNACERLVSVTLPTSIVELGGGAFCGCIRLTEINLPTRITTIEPYTFAQCENLQTITLPGTVKKIRTAVFFDCNRLTSVKLDSEPVFSVGAFRSCLALESVEPLPKTLNPNVLPDYVFYNCPNLLLSGSPSQSKWVKAYCERNGHRVMSGAKRFFKWALNILISPFVRRDEQAKRRDQMKTERNKRDLRQDINDKASGR